MPIISRLAEALAAKVDKPLTDAVHGWTAAGARFGLEGDARREHERWLRSARLNVTYFGPRAFYEWMWPENVDDPFLVCTHAWTFVRRTRDGELVTADEVYSFQAWAETGYNGLTEKAPRKPDRPREFNLTAADHREMVHGTRFERVKD